MPYGIVMFALAGAVPALVVIAAVGAQIYWISPVAQLGGLLRQSATQAQAVAAEGA
jgi:hypothetical protein